MQPSYRRHDHRGRHRYSSHLCASQHRRDHRVPVGRVRDRMVHRSAAPAPPRTARRRVTYRAAIVRWPRARITLRQGIRVVHDTGSQPRPPSRAVPSSAQCRSALLARLIERRYVVRPVAGLRIVAVASVSAITSRPCSNQIRPVQS